MTLLTGWRARLAPREQLQQWGVLALLSLLLLGVLLMVGLVLLPEIRQRTLLRSQIMAAEAQLAQAQAERAQTPIRLQTELAEAQTRLQTAANSFLGEAEATLVLNRLYTYAQATGVEIVNLQTATATTTEIYVQRNFQFQIAGSLDALLDFLGSMDEVRLAGFFVDHVTLTPVDAATNPETNPEANQRLSLSVSLYTSPYAGQENTLLPLDHLADLPFDRLQTQLEADWAAGDWERVIRLLDQVLAVEPEHEPARLALYRAHVNTGYQLLAARRSDAAQAEFETALAIRPEGREAQAELDQLAHDAALAYTVQDRLRQDLNQATGSGDWSRAIQLLRLIEAVDPHYGPVTDQLFTAYVNYGSRLAAQGNAQAAEEQYVLAHTLAPDRELPPLPAPAPIETALPTAEPPVIAASYATPAPPQPAP